MIKVILRAGAAVILTLVVIWIITQVFIFLFPGYTIPIFSLNNVSMDLDGVWGFLSILAGIFGLICIAAIIESTISDTYKKKIK